MSCLEKPDYAGALPHEIEEELFRRYYPDAYSYLLSLCRDAMVAEDLAQDVLVVVLRRYREGRLHSLDLLRAYIRRVARSLWISRLRRSENNRLVYLEAMDTELENLQDTPNSTGPDMAQPQHADKQYRDALLKVFSVLQVSRDRDLLVRDFVYEQSKEQVCADIGLSSRHFDRVLSRARIRLRRELEKLSGNDLYAYISSLLDDQHEQ